MRRVGLYFKVVYSSFVCILNPPCGFNRGKINKSGVIRCQFCNILVNFVMFPPCKTSFLKVRFLVMPTYHGNVRGTPLVCAEKI